MDLTVNQSCQATFSCTTQGNPVPNISWTGPSTNFTTEATPGANFTVLSMLTIDSAVREDHEGPYTCSASNGVGPSPSSSAALTVQGTAGDPPPHNTRCTVDWPHQTPAPIALQVSSPAVMCCSSSPSPSSLSSPHCASCPGKRCGYPGNECRFDLYHLGCLPRGANREHPVDL